MNAFRVVAHGVEPRIDIVAGRDIDIQYRLVIRDVGGEGVGCGRKFVAAIQRKKDSPVDWYCEQSPDNWDDVDTPEALLAIAFGVMELEKEKMGLEWVVKKIKEVTL